MTVAGHRWEYQTDMCAYECIPLPLGSVESYQWCVGCACTITDLELCKLKVPCDGWMLDIIAHSKGFSPIQSGTREEMFLNIRRSNVTG